MLINEKNILDQYFTKKHIAEKLFEKTKNIISQYEEIEKYTWLEPSVGEGCFYDLLPKNKKIGVDIDPKRKDVIKGDYLKYKLPDKPLIIIGNPPFGHRGVIALEFINHSKKADFVCFILPMFFDSKGKGSIRYRVKGFNLIYSEKLEENAFYTPDNNEDIDIKCVFQERERLYNNIFEHLKLEMSKLIDIKTTEYTKDDRTKYLDANKSLVGDWDRTTTHNNFEKAENREAQRITNKEKPYSTIDLIHGDYGHLQDRADWLATEAITDTGYIGIEKDAEGNPVLDSEGKPNKIINPNWNKRTSKGRNKDYSHKSDKTKEDQKETDHGTIDKTITTQEQPIFYQQLARIMPSFSLVETKIDDLTDFSHLFDNVFLPEGEFRWNSNTFQIDYITRAQLIEEAKPEKKKTKPIKDPDQDLSFDEWNEFYQEQEVPLMPTWYLERLYRYQKKNSQKAQPGWNRSSSVGTLW